jgi:hypothetical protein
MNNFNKINNDRSCLYDEENWINNIFYLLFGSIANEINIYNKYNVEEAAKHIISYYNLENKPENIRRIMIKNNQKKNIYYTMHKLSKAGRGFVYYIIIKEGCLVQIDTKKLVILHNDKIKANEIDILENELSKFIKKKKEKKKDHFYMIVKGFDGFELSKYKVKGIEPYINLHYNDDIIPFDTVVKEFLKDKTKNGMILLHGKSGTGKTTYIRHLIRETNRKFIYLPLFMAEALSSPDLLPFLSEHKNSVLIIEDSEKLIASRETSNDNSDIAALLNISDGLLNDALGIKLICTFNTELSNIDKALLRKGRLITRYEFKELSIEKASKIAETNNLPYDGKKPISIGNLFNIEIENQSDINEKKNIGFSL